MAKKYLDQFDDGNPNEDDGLDEGQISELIGLVGETTFSFNELESRLEGLIVEAVNARSNQPGYTIVAELTPVFTKKISVFQAMYGILVECADNAEIKPLFLKIISDLYKIKDIRNEVTHANWIQASRKYEVRLKIMNDEKGPYTVTKIMTPEILRSDITKIDELIEQLERFGELSGI